MDHKRRICVRGIIYKNGQLFCQELKHKDGTPKGFWCTPGGGLEPGESLIEGVRREIVEETGVEPVVGKLVFVQQYSEISQTSDHAASEFLEFFFHIENPDDFSTVDLDNTSHGNLEVARCEFIDTHTDTILPKFLRTLNITSYIDGNKPVFLHDEFGQ